MQNNYGVKHCMAIANTVFSTFSTNKRVNYS